MTCSILRSAELTDYGRGTAVILGDGVDKSANAAPIDVADVLANAVTAEQYDGIAQDMQLC